METTLIGAALGATIHIWTITDGRAGNRTQALGLAEAIARTRSAEITEHRIDLKTWAVWIPPALSWRLTGLAGWPLGGVAGGRAGLAPPWPDLIVGAGRRSAPIVAALRKRHGIKAVQLLSPQMPADAFDAVVVPSHDDLNGSNVLTTLGALNRMTAGAIRDAAEAWEPVFAPLPRPRVAVLIGGPSRSSGFGDADCGRLRQALAALTETHGLIVTPSRRTPGDLTRALAGLGPGTWTWDGSGDNPYPALLGHVDAVMVTEESVNMASEAATSGLPVHVFPVSQPAPKIARFQQALAARGASRRFEGRIEAWAYQPLAEADRIAAELATRGLVPPAN